MTGSEKYHVTLDGIGFLRVVDIFGTLYRFRVQSAIFIARDRISFVYFTIRVVRKKNNTSFCEKRENKKNFIFSKLVNCQYMYTASAFILHLTSVIYCLINLEK